MVNETHFVTYFRIPYDLWGLWVISLFHQNRKADFLAFRYGLFGDAVIYSAYSIIEVLYLLVAMTP